MGMCYRQMSAPLMCERIDTMLRKVNSKSLATRPVPYTLQPCQ